MTEHLVTTAQLAKTLGVTVQRVQQLVAEGKLTSAMKAPGIRGAYFYSQTEVQRILGERQK